MADCCSNAGRNYHCARCHNSFTSLRLFDKHQDVDYERTERVICVAPAELGLVRDFKGIWCTPEAAATRLASAEAFAAAKTAKALQSQ